MSNQPNEKSSSENKKALRLLALGALGVVYGDIGTSPLYAVRECFHGPHRIDPNAENILGVLSLIIWCCLVTVVSVKYLLFVLEADNRGEGGVLALMALVQRKRRSVRSGLGRLPIFLGIFGASLLYGDGIITPAISVLSAVEGLTVATNIFEPFVVPISLIILLLLFLFQRQGTGRIGFTFGPIVLAWFAVMGLLGLYAIVKHPAVLAALNPLYALSFLFSADSQAFMVLGAVFLVVTGTEALYADMGHFGKQPIRIGWFYAALPALLLNYLGQGALLLAHPEAAINPFFHLAPQWALYPVVLLATAATVIASQALISGAFSLTRQAVQLGYLPRMKIMHTSSRKIGQIYIPSVNFMLLLGTVSLVLAFRSSSGLAAAYGVAVSTTMILTTVLMYFVVRERWKWKLRIALPVILPLVCIDLMFFSANVSKLLFGGWVSLLLGFAIVAVMLTWWRGRQILGERVQTLTPPFARFIEEMQDRKPIRVPGTAIFMTRNIDLTPPALIHNLKHNKVLHERVLLLMVSIDEQAHVSEDERVSVSELGQGIHRVVFHYGFMESPNIPGLLGDPERMGFEIDLSDTTFFFGRESVVAAGSSGMMRWREDLFRMLSQNAQRAMVFYGIPSAQVVEIGFQIEL